ICSTPPPGTRLADRWTRQSGRDILCPAKRFAAQSPACPITGSTTSPAMAARAFSHRRSPMKTLLLTALAAGLLAGPGDAPADAKKEKEKLQGTWKAVTVETGGQSKDDTQDICLILAGDEFTFKRGDGIIGKGKFKIDPCKNPKQIDLEITEDPTKEENKGKTVLAIYAVDGDQLKWCLSKPGGVERPKEFAAPAGTNLAFLTLKREKSN